MSAQPRDTAALRAVKIAVVVMGVVIIAGVAMVVGVIISRIYAKPPAPSMILPAPASSLLPAATLNPGEHIAGLASAGGQFAVWVNGPAGDRLLLLNAETGAVSVALAAPK
jgi:hypothetical protein